MSDWYFGVLRPEPPFRKFPRMTSEVHIERLTELNLDIARWEQLRDDTSIRELDAVLSPSLIFRRANGSVVNKETFIRDLQQPSPFSRRDSEEVVVVPTGGRAVVTLYVLGTKRDGSVGRYRNVRLFFRHGDRWQLEFWFNDDATAVAPQ